jgi:hypothetical protein
MQSIDTERGTGNVSVLENDFITMQHRPRILMVLFYAVLPFSTLPFVTFCGEDCRPLRMISNPILFLPTFLHLTSLFRDDMSSLDNEI